MKRLIENMTGGYSSSASVVDDNLIISLPDAQTPVVWRMDLSKVKTSALEIKENKNGHFVLTFKSEKGELEEIAPFDNRALAVKALMTISSAMQNTGSASTRVAANSSSVNNSGANTAAQNSKGKWAGPLLGVGVLFLLVYILLTMSPSRPVSTDNAADQQSAFSATSADPNGQTGVPQSADAFLMAR